MVASTQQIIIIGTGFAGIAMAYRLKQAGLHNFIILERAAQIGGTWRDNYYPGAACDVASHLYSFSFAPNPSWSRKFSPQQEILDYLKKCANDFEINKHIRFNAQVVDAKFDETEGLWSVSTLDGAIYRTKFLIRATGGLSELKFPEIPGLRDFKGRLFHSAHWQQDASLTGLSVGVIGTGASAIQIVPAITPEVRRLTLFQRTPAWVVPRFDRAYSPREKRLKALLPIWARLIRYGQYWRNEAFGVAMRHPALREWSKKILVRHLYSQVKDPELRLKLTPNYSPGCKRILLSDDYYPALTQSHVKVETSGIERITAGGIRTKDGQEHELDALICATGFSIAEAINAFRTIGLDGRDLGQIWGEEPEAYRATSVSGFPNLFMIVGPNSGLGHTSIVLMIEAQAQYILDGINKIERNRLKYVDVLPDQQDAYNQELQDELAESIWIKGGCVSWYNSSTGRNSTLWPGTTLSFRWQTRRFDIASYRQVPLDAGPKIKAEKLKTVT
jgi:cation diffusion facilitator CzcD-associated flavoprotein CzcO